MLTMPAMPARPGAIARRGAKSPLGQAAGLPAQPDSLVPQGKPFGPQGLGAAKPGGYQTGPQPAQPAGPEERPTFSLPAMGGPAWQQQGAAGNPFQQNAANERGAMPEGFNANNTPSNLPPWQRPGSPGQYTGGGGGGAGRGGAGAGGVGERYGLPSMPGGVDALPQQVLNPGQVNQIANQGINQLSTGANDRIRQLEDRLAGTGASGALADQSDQILSETANQASGVRAQAGIDAARENAQYGLARQQNQLQQRSQDMNYNVAGGQLGAQQRGQDIERENNQGQLGLGYGQLGLQAGLGYGRLGLDTQLGLGGLGLQSRGQDIQRELGLGQIGTQQRGQTLDYQLGVGNQQLGARGQDLNYSLGTRGQDVEARGQDTQSAIARLNAQLGARGQDLNYGSANRGQDLSYLQSLLGYQTQNRGQDLNYLLGGREQDLQGRGQDLNYLLGGRGQDLGWAGQQLNAATAGAGFGTQQRGQDIGYAGQMYGYNQAAQQAQQQRQFELMMQALRGG